MDRMDLVYWVQESFKDQNQEFANHCILESSNDDIYNKGLFMLVTEVTD